MCCGTVWHTSTPASTQSSTIERRRSSVTRSWKCVVVKVDVIVLTQLMRSTLMGAVLAWLHARHQTNAVNKAALLYTSRQLRRLRAPCRSQPLPQIGCPQRHRALPQTSRSVSISSLTCWLYQHLNPCRTLRVIGYNRPRTSTLCIDDSNVH